MLGKKLLVTVVTLHIFFFLSAQDANYWSNHYGAGGFFLPGAVIVNNGDSGVFYYNPALLKQSKMAVLSASATVYQFDKTKITNGAGTGKDLISDNTGSTALMLVGNIKIPSKHPWYIGYGILQQPGYNFAVTQRRDDKFNVLDNSYSPGPEEFVGQYLNQNSSKEASGVISAGFNLSKRLSFGVTIEGYHRKQTINYNYYARALVNPEAGSTLQLVSYDESYYVSYSVNGLRGKLGLAWEGDKNKFGLLITSPDVNIGGTGTLLSDVTYNNIDPGAVGLPFSFLANTRQENLKAHWKKPVSIAAGYSHFFHRWIAYASVEYFAAVKDYNIITPRKEFFIRPDTGTSNVLTPYLLKLKDARRPVCNWAIGASYLLNDRHTIYFALRSDYTWVDNNRYTSEEGYTANASQWNIYHFQTGLNLRREKYNFRVGGYVSYGQTNSYAQYINFDNPNEENSLTGNPVNTKAHYISAGLMISYLHNF